MGAHGPGHRMGDESGPLRRVALGDPCRQQELDPAADHLGTPVAEGGLDLGVRVHDLPVESTARTAFGEASSTSFRAQAFRADSRVPRGDATRDTICNSPRPGNRYTGR